MQEMAIKQGLMENKMKDRLVAVEKELKKKEEQNR
jgi:hypothetical protein